MHPTRDNESTGGRNRRSLRSQLRAVLGRRGSTEGSLKSRRAERMADNLLKALRTAQRVVDSGDLNVREHALLLLNKHSSVMERQAWLYGDQPLTAGIQMIACNQRMIRRT